VLGKMDGVSDLWLTAAEWVSFRSQTITFNTLALTHPSRTSWGYGDFVNAASTCKLVIFSLGVFVKLAHCIKPPHDSFNPPQRRFRFLRDDSMLNIENNILRSRFLRLSDFHVLL
jgi:hypothetical protein